MAAPNCTTSALFSTAAIPPASIRSTGTTSPTTRNPATSRLMETCRSIWKPIPTGGTGPDQGTPRELKNPIHLETRDLVFNQESGDATTNARVDFRTPQASGWAWVCSIPGKTNTLTLVSQIHVTMGGQKADKPFRHSWQNHSRSSSKWCSSIPTCSVKRGTVEADQATFFLGPENEVQRVLATGNVNAESSGEDADPMRARADRSRDVAYRQTKPAAHGYADRQCPRRAHRLATHAGRCRTRDPGLPGPERTQESARDRWSPADAA